MTLRVVLVDDHRLFRAGVRTSLGDAVEIVGEAETVDEAVDLVRRRLPDVVLLDVHMPGNGIAAAREIAASAPDTAIVMLTVSRDDADLFEALRAGARGYLLKDIDPSRLPHALRGVLSGEAALPRGLVAKLVEEFRGRDRAPTRGGTVTAALTSREWQVLELLRQGESTAGIAKQLFVSPVTVRTHVSAVLRKLKVDSREAAVQMLQGPDDSA